MKILKTGFLLLILLLSSKLFAQPFRERVMDSVMLVGFNKAGYKQMTTTWSHYEGTTLTEIQIYDQRGLRTGHLQYNGYHWTRHKESFDSLRRKTAFIFFDEKDTTLVTSTHIFTYLDSLSYKEEVFNRGTELTNTTLKQYKKVKDTLWITETKTAVNSNRVDKNLHRITTKGDTLTISEYVKYDNAGKIRDIDTYYHLKSKDKKGNDVYTGGKYEVIVDESIQINEQLYLDALKTPEKYHQYQLDGKYPYKYADEITSIRIYNPKGQLISNKDYSSKKTYEYNALGQTVKTESFSQMPGGTEQKISEEVFYYDQRNLPVKVVEIVPGTGQIITYQFTFN